MGLIIMTPQIIEGSENVARFPREGFKRSDHFRQYDPVWVLVVYDQTEAGPVANYQQEGKTQRLDHG